MTKLLVKFSDLNVRDETVECDSWDTYDGWFRCKGSDGGVIFQAQTNEILFFRTQTSA